MYDFTRLRDTGVGVRCSLQMPPPPPPPPRRNASVDDDKSNSRNRSGRMKNSQDRRGTAGTEAQKFFFPSNFSRDYTRHVGGRGGARGGRLFAFRRRTRRRRIVTVRRVCPISFNTDEFDYYTYVIIRVYTAYLSPSVCSFLPPPPLSLSPLNCVQSVYTLYKLDTNVHYPMKYGLYI